MTQRLIDTLHGFCVFSTVILSLAAMLISVYLADAADPTAEREDSSGYVCLYFDDNGAAVRVGRRQWRLWE